MIDDLARRGRFGLTLLVGLASFGCDGGETEEDPKRLAYDHVIATIEQPDPERLPSLSLIERQLRRPKPLLLSIRFPGVDGLVADAWLYEQPHAEEIRHEARPDGGVTITHDLRDLPASFETVVTPRPGQVDFVVHYRADPGETLPEDMPQPILCYQLKLARDFMPASDRNYGDFGRRGFVFRGDDAITMIEWPRTSVSSNLPENEHLDWWEEPGREKVFFPQAQRYVTSWRAPLELADGTSPAAVDHPIVAVTSRDGAHLTALAGPDAYIVAQLWHACLHLEQPWRIEGEEATWSISAYALPNDPAALLARVRADYPEVAERSLGEGSGADPGSPPSRSP